MRVSLFIAAVPSLMAGAVIALVAIPGPMVSLHPRGMDSILSVNADLHLLQARGDRRRVQPAPGLAKAHSKRPPKTPSKTSRNRGTVRQLRAVGDDSQVRTPPVGSNGFRDVNQSAYTRLFTTDGQFRDSVNFRTPTEVNISAEHYARLYPHGSPRSHPRIPSQSRSQGTPREFRSVAADDFRAPADDFRPPTVGHSGFKGVAQSTYDRLFTADGQFRDGVNFRTPSEVNISAGSYARLYPNASPRSHARTPDK